MSQYNNYSNQINSEEKDQTILIGTNQNLVNSKNNICDYNSFDIKCDANEPDSSSYNQHSMQLSNERAFTNHKSQILFNNSAKNDSNTFKKRTHGKI